MIDLKVTKSDRKKNRELDVPDPGDEYPYGLRLHLDTDTLKKLGIGVPNVGQKFTIVATGVVRSASEHKRSNGHSERSAEIQITKAEFKKPKGSATAAVKAALKEV